jgi:hypothetical protein
MKINVRCSEDMSGFDFILHPEILCEHCGKPVEDSDNVIVRKNDQGIPEGEMFAVHKACNECFPKLYSKRAVWMTVGEFTEGLKRRVGKYQAWNGKNCEIKI